MDITPIMSTGPGIIPMVSGIGTIIFGAAVAVYLKKTKAKLRSMILRGTG